MRRRAAGVAVLAAAAAAAGGVTAWWRSRRAGAVDEAAVPDVWVHSFPVPDGGSMRMADLRGRPLLLNFWATWCGPCVMEMPLLARFSREQASSGLRVLALAIDGVDAVRRFVDERSLTVPVALAGAEGIDLSRALGNAQGALPFSVMFNASGSAVARNLGAVNSDLLAHWVGLTR